MRSHATIDGRACAQASRRLAECLIALLLTGCAVKRDVYVVPHIPVPNQFRQAQLTPPSSPAQSTAPAEEAIVSDVKFVDEMLAQWWRALGNKELEALVDQAMANNADLRIATLRIVQSKARFEQAKSDELPVLTAPFEARTEAPAGGVGSVSVGQEVISRRLYQGSLRGDLRVDVWGERRALAESSQLQLWRSIYQRDDTRRAVVATLVTQYVEYLSLNDRLRVARETELVLRGMLEAVAGRLKGGDATITDLEQQRAAVYSVQATIPGIELQRENAINAIAQTLGATPGLLALSHRGMDSLAFPRVLPGVPANLLLRRPDVRAVEARLLAADADIDVARARLLPSIDLTAQVGYGSLAFSRLLHPHNLVWNIIGNLSATIFDHGKRGNEVTHARALHEELVETYVRVLYTAIRETEDAIATVQMNAKRLEAQGAAARAAKRAWDLSIESYREGAIDYLTLLDTERTYHRILDEFHRISMERHKGLVALFSSLGGGVPKNAPAPSRGDPPSDVLGADYATRVAAQAPIQFHPHDISGRLFWLVELAGLQDRVGVNYVWRDLMNRFPDLMSDRVLLPRLQGRVGSGSDERTAWYRVFLSKFHSPEAASEFCDKLKAALIRCQALRSDSSAFQEMRDSPLLDTTLTAQTPMLATALEPGSKPSGAGPRPATRDGKSNPSSLHTVPMDPALRNMPDEPGRPPAPTPPMPTKQGPPVPPELSGMVHTSTGAVSAAPSLAPRPASEKSTSVQVSVFQSHAGPPTQHPQQSEVAKRVTRLGYAVQLATVHSASDAQTLLTFWSRKGYATYLYPVQGGKGIQYTVRTGIYSNQQEAVGQAARIRTTELVTVVPVPVVLDEAGQPAPLITTSPR